MTDVAPFYDDLTASLAEARLVLEGGAKDRNSPAHTPVVATLDEQGLPSQRVLILRAIDWAQRRLRFHTDARSGKVGELAKRSAASVLIYHPQAKVQLRLTGTAHVETDGEMADHAWNSSTLFARRCYLAEAGPGSEAAAPTSGLPHWVEGLQPTDEQVAPARGNFAVLLFSFDTVEWLYLANQGHRRARWDWDSVVGDWVGNWLVP